MNLVIQKYCRRLAELGLRGTASRIKVRVARKIFYAGAKPKALAGTAHHTWAAISQRHVCAQNFEHFFNHLDLHHFDRLRNHRLMISSRPAALQSPATLLRAANKIVAHEVDILGSGLVACGEKIPWLADIKRPASLWGTEYWNQGGLKFFMDITARPCCHTDRPLCHPELVSGSNPVDHPDIKVPWELSRFHQLVVLGLAYQQTGDAVYARDFKVQVESWWAANPYLLGVNWVCPMDVGLRAVNLIWACALFKRSSLLTTDFWQQVVESLYDHARYLEKTWEVSDKPNNHYLADLVGYLYLAGFFYEIPYFKKQFSKILAVFVEQVGQQIQPDGSSYEGSTAYHRLDTEMVAHVIVLCEVFVVPVPLKLTGAFEKMVTFLQDCSDAVGNFIKIGDDDSSKVVTGFVVSGVCNLPKYSDVFFNSRRSYGSRRLLRSLLTKNGLIKSVLPEERARRASVSRGDGLVTYPQAGITIFKAGAWHVTCRHSTFDRRQPTGHFHHDELAVTLSLAGRLVFGDPGSYLYTPSKFWRDYFRSPAAHNTFFIGEFEQNPADLFALDRPATSPCPAVKITEDQFFVADVHHRYAGYGATAGRTVMFDRREKVLTMVDQLTFENQPAGCVVTWNVHGAPEVTFVQEGENVHEGDQKTWLVLYENVPLARLTSTLPLICRPDFYAPAYGVVVPTQTLTAVTLWAAGRHETVIRQV